MACVISIISRKPRNRLKTADRHAKKELKKRVRGVRTIERTVTASEDATNEVVQGYCQAVRAALTDDGRPPLEASGLKLHYSLFVRLTKAWSAWLKRGVAQAFREVETAGIDGFRANGIAVGPYCRCLRLDSSTGKHSRE